MFVGVACLVAMVYFFAMPRGPGELTQEHLDAIDAVHREHSWTKPLRSEVSGAGFVTLTYEVTGSDAIVARAFGQARLLAVREALLRFGFRNYRVNVNGPPPGTGLVRRYGAARYVEGGQVEWVTP